MMTSYKLTYFPDRFRTEVCRLLFVLAEVEFDDYRVDYMEWETTLKKQSKAPVGDLPILEIFDVEGNTILMPQSRAIQKYLANEFGLYGENNKDKAIIDVVTECFDEILDAAAKIMFAQEETKKAQLRTSFLEGTGPRLLSYLESLLEESDSGFFVGQKPTLADVAIFNCIDVVKDWVGEEPFSSYPRLLALRDKIQKIESIAAYLAKRHKCLY